MNAPNGTNAPKTPKNPTNNGNRDRRKQHNPYKGIFLRNKPEYLKAYLDLEKQARTWRSQGQHWLALECERRMNCLLEEDMVGYNVRTHSETLFRNTKRF